MNNKTNISDEIISVGKDEINKRLKKITKLFINNLFDFLEVKLNDIPDSIKKLRNSQEMEQKLVDIWSNQLFEDELIPEGYKGLPDNLLIKNFHQEGYLDGLYVGYILAMMALVDNDVSEDIIISVRDYIRPNLVKNHYDCSDKFINLYKNDKYNWIEKENA